MSFVVVVVVDVFVLSYIICSCCVCCTKLSDMECGLLPLSQDAMSLGVISYAEYGGGGDSDETSIIREAFGAVNKVVRNNHIVYKHVLSRCKLLVIVF